MAGPKGRIESLACRSRWTAEEAAEVLAEAMGSGLPLREFAALHGVDAQRLYRWRRELGGMEAPSPIRFEEVPVPRTAVREHGAGRIELVLPAGHVIRLSTDFDAASLRRLLEVLGEVAGPC